MNPFDFQGPQFLLFYAVFTAIVIGVLRVRLRMREASNDQPAPRIHDAYLISYLRAGKASTIDCAVVSMIDRKLLEVKAEGIRNTGKVPIKQLADPLEAALAKQLPSYTDIKEVQKFPLDTVFAAYDVQLQKLGLMPNATQQEMRNADFSIAVIALGMVGVTKMFVGLARGRPIVFLVILTVIAIVAAYKLSKPRRTGLGDKVVEDLSTLMSSLKGRATSFVPNASSQELLILAAVFGVSALPLTAFPQKQVIWPRATASSSGCGSSSCGSNSCSSGSDSGGSSCGGGGCGGGCGGCGS